MEFKIYESKMLGKSYGKFIVKPDIVYKNGELLYKVEFLDTGFITYANEWRILKGQVVDSLLPLKEYFYKEIETKNYGKFITYPECIYDESQQRYKYKVVFTKTGYTCFSCRKEIVTGYIKDPFYPSIFGLAFLGNSKKSDDKQLYAIWFAMLNRCLNPSNKQFKYYGDKKVTVCKEWLCFETFLQEVQEVEGFDKKLIANRGLHLDKDFKQQGLSEKIYSKDTCIWIPSSLNCSHTF